MSVCVRVRVHACVHVCLCVCARAHTDVCTLSSSPTPPPLCLHVCSVRFIRESTKTSHPRLVPRGPDNTI